MAFEHSFSNLLLIAGTFGKDRPVLQAYNEDPQGRVKAFLTEVDELNGPDKSGFFGETEIGFHPERLADYRQQEVADIMLIGLSLPEIFHFSLDDQKILAEANYFAELLGIQIVSESEPLKPVMVFTEQQESVYSLLKNLLNAAVEKITPELMLNPEEASAALERVLTFCYVLFYLMGLSPVRACLEKISRNMLKYLAVDYLESETPYKTREKQSKDAFDGPVDPVTGLRPQWGTREFYGPQEIVPESDWSQRQLTLLPALSPAAIEAMAAEAENAWASDNIGEVEPLLA